MFRTTTALITTFLCVMFASAADAQVFNPSINPAAPPPITVSQTDEKAGVRPGVADQRLVNIAFGATANGGNSKSYGGNLGGRFALIRNFNQLTIEALGNLAGARQTGKRNVSWTARNVIARARYDLFLSQWDALFVAIAPRRDRFAGLGLRLQNQIGYSRNLFFPVDAHRFWTELGYDFTYDHFSSIEGATPTAAKPSTPMQTITNGATPTSKEDPYIHSARVFFGYTNRLTPTATLTTGMENLFDFRDGKNVRINGLVEFTSSLTQTFKLGLQSRLMFDNVPVPGAKKLDSLTVAQLVYTFDSHAATPAAACPVCDCTAQVDAAKRECRAQLPAMLAPPPAATVPTGPTDGTALPEPTPSSADAVPTPQQEPLPVPPPAAPPVVVPALPPVPTP